METKQQVAASNYSEEREDAHRIEVVKALGEDQQPDFSAGSIEERQGDGGRRK